MSRLVLKYHATRGKEVINLLEMLGANRLGYKDTFVGFYYYIECEAIVSSDEYPIDAKVFTLEEFLEKYPFKVGDKVITYTEGCIASFSIKDMRWNNKLNKVEYKICSAWYDVSVLSAIQPYTDYDIKTNKEEDTSDLKKCGTATIKYIDGRYILRDKKPQYPKTYKECCDVLGLNTMGNDSQGYKEDLMIRFQELIIARDAYWKIAGEQMGLDKPWKPDWTNCCATKYSISCVNNKIKLFKAHEYNYILVFPTAEMRDAFYDAFKELINEVKELL